MRKLTVLLALLFFSSLAAGAIQHEIHADEEKALINTTVQLDCDPDSGNCPVNYWTLSWSKPSGAEVLSIRDSLGEVEDYTVSGDEIQITTNSGRKRTNETVEIKMLMDGEAEEVHAGLYKRTFSLPGFKDSRTTGFIEAPELVSGRVSFGFESSFVDDRLKFRGRGPANIRIKTGSGYETRYFSFFGDEVDDAEIAYEVPVGTLGIVQSFERFPVAVMDNSTYNRKVNLWSAGEYVSGAIQIRSPETIDEEFLPVLAHEVVHGLNDRELNWDQTRSSYFDEGTAKYIEFLVKRKLYSDGKIESRPAELFGDEVKYTKKENGKRYIYTVPSEGDRERLWSYYQNDRDFMKSWNAIDSSPENRGFGYAYSQLVVRNYIANGGELSQLYRDISVGREVSDKDEKWEIYSRHLDMTPCKTEDRERFESCLEDINDYSYPVYSASPSPDREKLDIKRLQVPNRTEQLSRSIFKGDVENVDAESISGFLRSFIDYWLSVLQDLVASL